MTTFFSTGTDIKLIGMKRKLPGTWILEQMKQYHCEQMDSNQASDITSKEKV